MDADPVEARRWFLQAAEQGDAWAEYEPARRYWTGQGVEQKRDEALGWLEKAAAQGLHEAIALLDEVRSSTE